MVRAYLSFVICMALGLGWLAPTDARGDLIIPTDFTLFATHPDAQLQATQRGRTIRDIIHFNGQLYTGYGDWAYDDGPVQIRGLDSTAGTWSSSSLSFSTEALSHYRVLGGQLYAASTDPQGMAVQPGGFALGTASHQWSQHNVVAATHVFDVNQTSGSDLWMVGSVDIAATVWRSTDGGASFSVARQDTPPAGAPGFAFSRYVGAAVLNGNLYVQRVDVNSPTHNAQSLMFDGANWLDGPDLLSAGGGFVSKPQQFGNQLVYMDDDLSLGQLYRFDGSVSQVALPGLVHDFQIREGQVIVLAQGGELLFTTDLTHWQTAGFAPLEARSLELVGNQLFVGTTNAQILSSFKLGGISAVPEPGSLVGLLSVVVLIYPRRRRRELA